MLKFLLFSVSGCLCIAALQAQPRKLAIVGSSTSACTGPSTYDSCYVGRLVNYYNAINAPITVYNIAIGGTNPYQAMPTGYIPPAGRPPTNTNANITNAINSNPGVILINFPSNGYCDYTVAEVMNCFRIMKQAATMANIACYITTTQPREEGCFLGSAIKLKMTQIKDSVLAQFGNDAIDFYTTLADPTDSTIANLYNSGDGIHLNNAGHRILFERVRDKNIFSQVILPLKFISFTGTIKNNEGLLEWKTAAAANLKNFEVQKSADGTHYNVIGQVAANNPFGQNTYFFVDKTGLSATNYYRLNAVDKDGKMAMSATVKLDLNNKVTGIKSVYTNTGAIYAEIYATASQPATLQLFNGAGQQLASENISVTQGNTTVRLTHLVNSGLYFFKITDSHGNADIKKVVAQ